MAHSKRTAGLVTRAALRTASSTNRIQLQTDAQLDAARAIRRHIGDGLRHGREAQAQLLEHGRSERARTEINAAIAAFERAAWADDYAGGEQ